MSAPKTRWAPIALWLFLLFKTWQGGAFDGTAWRPATSQAAMIDQVFTGLSCFLLVMLTIVLAVKMVQARRAPVAAPARAARRKKSATSKRARLAARTEGT